MPTTTEQTQLVEFEARRTLAREFTGRGLDAADEVAARGLELGVSAVLVPDGFRDDGTQRLFVKAEALPEHALLEIPDDDTVAANIKERWARALMTDAPGVQGLVRMTEDVVQRCSAAEDEVVELRSDVGRWEVWAQLHAPHDEDCSCPMCTDAPQAGPGEALVEFIEIPDEDGGL